MKYIRNHPPSYMEQKPETTSNIIPVTGMVLGDSVLKKDDLESDAQNERNNAEDMKGVDLEANGNEEKEDSQAEELSLPGIERRKRTTTATINSLPDLSPMRKLPQIVVNDKERRRRFVVADCLRHGMYLFALFAVVSGIELIRAESSWMILIVTSKIFTGFVGMIAAHNQSWVLSFAFAAFFAVAYSFDVFYFLIWYCENPESLAIHKCQGTENLAVCVHSRVDRGPLDLIGHALFNSCAILCACYTGIKFGLVVLRIEREFFSKWKQDDELRGFETSSSISAMR